MITEMRLSLKQTVHTTVEALIEQLLNVSDFFVYRAKATASEGFLHAIILSRAIWYSIYGTTSGIYDHMMPDAVWITLFWALSIAHVIAMFTLHIWVRSVIVSIYAVIWTFLTVLSITTATTNAPSTPTFAVLAIFSVFIAVRLKRESSSV